MRRLIVQEWLSIDGFAADENGWTDFIGPTEDNEQSDRDILRDMESIDRILLGANTYELFSNYWPTEKSEGEIIADKINETLKIVFSHSLEDVHWGEWANAIQVKSDAIEAVKALKAQDGKDLIMWGSLSLFRSLLRENLVDELQIRTVPVILGKGFRLFDGTNELKFETKEVKKYESGTTLVKYVIK